MKQAVDATKVHKATVFRDILYDTLEYSTFGQTDEGLTFESLALFLEEGTTRENDISATLVELDDLEFVSLTDEFLKVAHRTKVNLGAGKESLNTDINGETTFHAGYDLPLNELTLLYGFFEAVPDLKLDCLVFGKLEKSMGGLDVVDIDLDFVADLDGQFTVGKQELFSGYIAFSFIADVYDDLIFDDLDHISADDIADAEALFTRELFEKCLKILFDVIIESASIGFEYFLLDGVGIFSCCLGGWGSGLHTTGSFGYDCRCSHLDYERERVEFVAIPFKGREN